MSFGFSRQALRASLAVFAAVTLALVVAALWQALFVPRLAQDWFGGATLIPDAQVKVVRGTVTPLPGGYQHISPINRSIVIEAKLPDAAAQTQPLVRWLIQRKDEKASATLNWLAGTTQASQSLIFRKDNIAEEWSAIGDPRWLGTIATVQLNVASDAPIVVGVLTLRADSVVQRLRLMWEGWFGLRPWKMADINFIEAGDASENYYFNLTVIAAMLLCAMSYSIFQRWHQLPVRFGVIAAIFLAGWAWSTLRWQVELVQKVAHSWQRYAGKTLHEKHLAADDHEYYWVIDALASQLPPSPKFTNPVFVHYANTERYDKGKLTYYAAPYPLAYLDKAPPAGAMFGVINVANDYDPASKQITLSNGVKFRAERVAERGSAAVFRAI